MFDCHWLKFNHNTYLNAPIIIQIYFKCRNLQSYLCDGRLPPLPAKRFPPCLAFEDESIRHAYRLVADVVQFSLYLQHALHQYKIRKEERGEGQSSSPMNDERFEDSLIRMKKNAKIAISLVDGVSELSIDIVKISLYPRVIELFWILGKRKKALKHASMHLEIVRDVGMASFCQSCLPLPQVFIEMQRVDKMQELVGLLDRFRILKDVGAFHNKCQLMLTDLEKNLANNAGGSGGVEEGVTLQEFAVEEGFEGDSGSTL